MPPTIEVERSDLIAVYRALNVVVVSLARFGSWEADQEPAFAAAALTQMLDDIDVYRRLSGARHVLDSYFDHTLGDDDMDEVGREFRDERGYWTAPS